MYIQEMAEWSSSPVWVCNRVGVTVSIGLLNRRDWSPEIVLIFGIPGSNAASASAMFSSANKRAFSDRVLPELRRRVQQSGSSALR